MFFANSFRFILNQLNISIVVVLESSHFTWSSSTPSSISIKTETLCFPVFVEMHWLFVQGILPFYQANFISRLYLCSCCSFYSTFPYWQMSWIFGGGRSLPSMFPWCWLWAQQGPVTVQQCSLLTPKNRLAQTSKASVANRKGNKLFIHVSLIVRPEDLFTSLVEQCECCNFFIYINPMIY